MKIPSLSYTCILAVLCVHAPLQAADAAPPAVQPPGDSSPSAAATAAQTVQGRRGGSGQSSAPALRPEDIKPIDDKGNFRFQLEQLGPGGRSGNYTNYQFSPVFNGNATANTTILDWLEAVKLSDKYPQSGAVTDSALLRFRVYSDDNNTLVICPSNARWLKTVLVNVGDLRKGKTPNYKITLGPLPPDYSGSFRGPSSGRPLLAVIDLVYPPFVFDGGSAVDFVAAVRKIYGVDWGILELPPEAANVRVPKMRVGGQSPDDMTAGSLGTSVSQVLELYNSLSEDNTALGKWKWGGNIYHPAAITLALPMNYAGATATKIKALSIAMVDARNQAVFIRGLESAIETVRRMGGTASLAGQLALQDDTKMLVVAGTPAYIDFVESYIEAYSKGQTAGPPRP